MILTARDPWPTGGTRADPRRWPDVAAVPQTRMRAAIARALVRRVAGRLGLRVAQPDGSFLGTDDPVAPVLILRRPDAFHRRLGVAGLVGFGESYQAGDWDAEDMPRLFTVFAENADHIVPRRLQWLRRFHGARQPSAERNTMEGARRNIQRHYDLSNDLFSLFLDETMTYSSALFDTDDTGRPVADLDLLAAAQHRKIDRLLDLTDVGPGTRVLEIGTGWGELAIRAAQRGAHVRTITISTEQAELARRRVAEAGLTDRVDVELRDYRELGGGSYDAIISVEMIEAVGERYWPTYFATLDRMLAPGGRVGLQAITMRHERLMATRHTYTWMHKYVFPGGLIPSIRAIEDTCGRHTRLRVNHLDAFGAHYAQTLRLWRERFHEHAAEISSLGFDETFRRTWHLYLSYCEAGFATGYLDVNHLVLGRLR